MSIFTHVLPKWAFRKSKAYKRGSRPTIEPTGPVFCRGSKRAARRAALRTPANGAPWQRAHARSLQARLKIGLTLDRALRSRLATINRGLGAR
jgi:hypothetical protein